MAGEWSLLKCASGERASGAVFRPQLTSLIDVMTILLVFLIKSFSVEGELVTPSRDLQLPLSTSRQTPRMAPTVAVTTSDLLADGSSLMSIEKIKAFDSLLLPPLYEWLAAMRTPDDPPAGAEIMIQADRAIRFEIIKKVMYTCSKAGFSDYSVLVLESDQ